jgi:hypothetical protein
LIILEIDGGLANLILITLAVWGLGVLHRFGRTWLR